MNFWTFGRIPQNLLPDFDYSDVLLDIVVSGSAVLFRRYRTCRWGKRAGALVKLHQRGLRTLLPSIYLANLRSLPNKTDKIILLSQTNKDFYNSAALCFTEAWLNDAIQRITSAEFPADQSTSQRRISGAIARRRDMLLHQWEVVYWCNCDALFRSRNALHQLQAVTRRGRFVPSFSWVSTVLRKRTWAQLYRNSLTWSQTPNKNTRTLF